MAQHPKAKLKGYDGPFYPNGLKELNKKLNIPNLSGYWLQAYWRHIESFSGTVRQRISRDGYEWFWVGEFISPTTPLSIILVAIPWSRDGDVRDEVSWDRSIALYTKGLVHPSELERLVQAHLEFLPDLEQEMRDEGVWYE